MKIRVGKNIYFTLTVLRLNDNPEDFTDARNIKLTANRKYSNFQVVPALTIRDNIIDFELPGGAPTGDYEVHLSYEKQSESSVTGIDKFFLDFCNAFTIVDSTCKEDTKFETETPSVNLRGVIERNKDGRDGVTPRVDPETKRWFTGIEDTGIVAEGKDGLTPFVGGNGNWWIGTEDTGKPSRGKAFEYSDFTGEEITELQEPARNMIEALDTLDKVVTAKEQRRIDNEVTRVNNENGRKEAENLRKSAEDTRVTGEEARKTAETSRVSSEQERATAESSRVEAENTRGTNEATRVENEVLRQTAEGNRDTAESERVKAESGRVAAESERVIEFNHLKTESETATQNATTQANYAKGQGDTVTGTVAEIKTAQSGLLTRVNDYMYDVSGLLVKLSIPSKFTPIMDYPLEGWYNEKGEFVPAPNGNSLSTPVLDVTPNSVYRLKSLVTSYGAFVCLYDKNGSLVKSLENASREAEGEFLFVGISKIAFSVRRSEVNTPLSGYRTIESSETLSNRALYVAAGAVYNYTTGFYELNGLTDITEEQMKTIYVQTCELDKFSSMRGVFAGCSFRTNLGFNRSLMQTNARKLDLYDSFRENRALEVLRLCYNDTEQTRVPTVYLGFSFYACAKLRKVTNVLKLDKSMSTNSMSSAFTGCASLQDIRLKELNIDISFKDSPLLSLESLQYLVNNATNTSAITITVHADVYAKIQDETNVEWHELLSLAQGKNITFATV